MTGLNLQSTESGESTGEAPAATETLARVKRSYLTHMPTSSDGASNDARFHYPSNAREALSAWAHHASAGNGFGGEPPGLTTDVAPTDAVSLAAAARAARTALFWRLVARCGHVCRQVVADWRRRRDEHATYRALSGLDPRTLRDIGLDRSEARSVAAELGGRADRTRAHALMTLRSLSI